MRKAYLVYVKYIKIKNKNKHIHNTANTNIDEQGALSLIFTR